MNWGTATACTGSLTWAMMQDNKIQQTDVIEMEYSLTEQQLVIEFSSVKDVDNVYFSIYFNQPLDEKGVGPETILPRPLGIQFYGIQTKWSQMNRRSIINFTWKDLRHPVHIVSQLRPFGNGCFECFKLYRYVEYHVTLSRLKDLTEGPRLKVKYWYKNLLPDSYSGTPGPDLDQTGWLLKRFPSSASAPLLYNRRRTQQTF
ncbi:MAG: hypothetical protein LBF65_02475 [Holosporales bacterium]|jgi:hypothetical protein|nr:hypothetical protein [Holosporales bacterium]